jgi:hypothetical protein
MAAAPRLKARRADGSHRIALAVRKLRPSEPAPQWHQGDSGTTSAMPVTCVPCP